MNLDKIQIRKLTHTQGWLAFIPEKCDPRETVHSDSYHRTFADACLFVRNVLKENTL